MRLNAAVAVQPTKNINNAAATWKIYKAMYIKIQKNFVTASCQ